MALLRGSEGTPPVATGAAATGLAACTAETMPRVIVLGKGRALSLHESVELVGRRPRPKPPAVGRTNRAPACHAALDPDGPRRARETAFPVRVLGAQRANGISEVFRSRPWPRPRTRPKTAKVDGAAGHREPTTSTPARPAPQGRIAVRLQCEAPKAAPHPHRFPTFYLQNRAYPGWSRGDSNP